MKRIAPWSLAAASALGLALAPSASAAPQVEVTAKPITKSLTKKNARTTVAVKNVTKRRLTGLTVTVGARKGVRVTVAGAKRGSRTRRLKPLAAGRTTKVTVRLRRTGKRPKSGTVSVRVRRNGKTRATGRLAFGPDAAPKMTGRYFWGSTYSLNGPRPHSLYFTGPKYVYTGKVKGEWPTCTTVTEDCRPYTFDAAKGELTVDGRKTELEGERLKVDDDDAEDGKIDGHTYWELGRPKAGARWDVVLTHSSASGICPLYCNYFTEHLRFSPDGTFVRGSVASGTGPVVDWAVVPDDSKGTYEVRKDRKLRLAFADGKERIETLGIYPGKVGYPDNPTAGAVLDGDGYFDIRD
ncbi:MAG: hypothetical protein M0P31_06565 [Solirubrobacteraceae bacterium]|nr:hypothetical protein [Solirubrobacteraceae bacterium]